MNNKKILFLTYDSIKAPLLYSQGIPLLKELGKRGYKTAIVTFENKLKNEKYYEDMLASYNIKWFKIKNCRFYIGPKSSGDILKGIMKVFFIVLKYNYSIIHCRSYIAGFIGIIVAKLTGKKHIFDMRGLYPDEYVLSGFIKKKSKIYRFYKWIEFVLIKFSDSVVVVSNQLANYVKKVYYKRINDLNYKLALIYNAVDLTKFAYNKNIRNILREKFNITNKFVFIYSGSLAKWQLWETSIKIFSILCSKYKDLFFLFLTYENSDIVEKFFCDYNISIDKYKIINANPQEIQKYLMASDIGLMLIYDHISREVSSPVKFGEFLSCGLPIIKNSPQIDFTRFIIKNRIGIVYNDSELDNKNLILEKFVKFRNNYNEKMRDRCIKVAEQNFNLEDAISKYIKIYESLLG